MYQLYLGENFLVTLVALAIDLQENWSNGKGEKIGGIESMIHDIGDQGRKRYYLIWENIINSGGQGRRDMHQQIAQ